MLLEDSTATTTVSHDSDEWTPPGWGTEEQRAKEAAEFAAWTRKMRPV